MKTKKQPQLEITHALLHEIEAVYVTAPKERKQVKRIQVSGSGDCAPYFRDVWATMKGHISHVESFAILHLNRTNKTIGWSLISQGGTAGTVCDPKLIFQAALNANAASIILAHNHPSGNNKPSQADINLTEKLVKAGQMLDLPVLDHLIMTENDGYYSFSDNGLI